MEYMEDVIVGVFSISNRTEDGKPRKIPQCDLIKKINTSHICVFFVFLFTMHSFYFQSSGVKLQYSQ